MKNSRSYRTRKVVQRIRDGRPEIIRELMQAVHDVQRFRQMNAAETPDQQDAWDRLQAAVLKAEQLDKPRQANRESSATAGTNGAP